MNVIGYEGGMMHIDDVDSLLSQYKARALRVNGSGDLELLILAEDEPVLVWMDIQEIEQTKTQ